MDLLRLEISVQSFVNLSNSPEKNGAFNSSLARIFSKSSFARESRTTLPYRFTRPIFLNWPRTASENSLASFDAGLLVPLMRNQNFAKRLVGGFASDRKSVV